MRKQFFGNNHPEFANSLQNIGKLKYKEGKYEEALKLLKDSLSIYKNLFGNKHPSIARTLEYIGDIYSDTSKYSQAIELYKCALKIYDNILPCNHPDILQLLNKYSILLLKLNRKDEAKLLLDRFNSVEKIF